MKNEPAETKIPDCPYDLETHLGRVKRRMFLRGFHDRKNGLPCRSANGAYLDGWYAIKK